uniref:Uncharacterized protein n=1 Tax=Hyaloperonospora arabidopsidis (strain Emoy2) TaxID=559515 RepID=M4B5D2_HYAAE
MPPMDDVSPTSSPIELERFSGFGAEPVETDLGSRSCRYGNGFSAAALTRAMGPETVERQGIEQSGSSIAASDAGVAICMSGMWKTVPCA